MQTPLKGYFGNPSSFGLCLQQLKEFKKPCSQSYVRHLIVQQLKITSLAELHPSNGCPQCSKGSNMQHAVSASACL